MAELFCGFPAGGVWGVGGVHACASIEEDADGLGGRLGLLEGRLCGADPEEGEGEEGDEPGVVPPLFMWVQFLGVWGSL